MTSPQAMLTVGDIDAFIAILPPYEEWPMAYQVAALARAHLSASGWVAREVVEDWYTIALRYRTKERLIKMLEIALLPPAPPGEEQKEDEANGPVHSTVADIHGDDAGDIRRNMGGLAIATLPGEEGEAWDKNHDQNALCQCGHPYYRHFDTYENMAKVGCKYCHCFEFTAPASVGDEKYELIDGDPRDLPSPSPDTEGLVSGIDDAILDYEKLGGWPVWFTATQLKVIAAALEAQQRELWVHRHNIGVYFNQQIKDQATIARLTVELNQLRDEVGPIAHD